MTFNKEARQQYLSFAVSPAALWSGNFRDFSASVTRMATLSTEGRIDRKTVDHELARLEQLWGRDCLDHADGLEELLAINMLEDMDPFDRVQLVEVVRISRKSKSMSEAGRTLFAASRQRRTTANDADRLKKYLARFGLIWSQLSARE